MLKSQSFGRRIAALESLQLCLIALLSACNGADSTEGSGTSTSETGDSTSGNSTSSEGSSTSTTSADETASSSGSPTGTDTTSSDSGSDSTGEVAPQCDDGIVSAGEFCFVDQAIAGVVVGDRGLEVLDINGDGSLDIATGSTLILANGDGTYSVTTPMPGGPFIAAGQLDADPQAEIVIPMPMTVEVHHADAGGAISAVDSYPFPGDFGYAAKIGDLLGSPELDIATVALSSGLLEIYENDAGVFTSQSSIVVGSGARHVEIADLDGDGLLDLIVAEDGPQVSWMMNSGAGFEPPISEAIGSLFTTLSIADVDLDGVPDMIGASPSGAFAEILYGDGAGGIESHQEIPLPVDPRAIGIGDFNSDGIPDLAAPSYENGTDLAIVLGEGGRTFAAPTTLAFPAWGHDIAVADLNEDGVDDIAVYGLGVGLLVSTP